MRSSARFGRDQDSASRIGAGQWRARRHGNAGIHGKVGIVESITCRIYRGRLSSNPTLSALLRAVLSVGDGSRAASRVQASALRARPPTPNPTLSANRKRLTPGHLQFNCLLP
jgi:hypothetical protein